MVTLAPARFSPYHWHVARVETRVRERMRNPPAPHGTTTGPATGSQVPEVPALTDLERQILDYMLSYLRANTYQPSIREIGAKFGIKSTKSVTGHLDSMVEKGFLERSAYRSRGIRIMGIELDTRTVSVPLFRDLAEFTQRAKAGDHGGWHPRISLDRRLAGTKGSFMVQAPGGLLAASGVAAGDFLVVEPTGTEEPGDGELVVASIAGAPDFYRVKIDGDRRLLCTMSGEEVDGAGCSWKLEGRVCALYRPMVPVSLGPSKAH